jgi:Cu(I)/Ag(I) efflux system membrane fusion protein
MKRIIITAAMSIALGISTGWLIFHRADANQSAERKIKFYRDPMNPQITSETPKKTSDGMDFIPVYAESSEESRRIAYYKDPMHPWYTSDRPGKAPDCGMDLVPVYEGENDLQGIKIDPVTVQNIGVKTETVQRRKLNRVIRTVGKVDYDERKLYSVNTKIKGWIENLYVDYTGKLVHKGDPLMDIYSPELVTTQEEYLQALQYRKNLRDSNLEEARKGAEDLVGSAKRRLQYWDIPESEISSLEERGEPKKTLTIYSPADGIVAEKTVEKGQNVMAGTTMFRIADLSTVWILADVYQSELPWVKPGQSADIQLSYLPGKIYHGRITYIYPYLAEETKTVKVRAEVPNTSSFDLKPDMFATVQIASPITVDAVAVPEEAVIRSGERNVVVVSLGGGYFDPRNVELGVSGDGYVQILSGIKEGEKIVVSSQFLIDSESNLKAAIGQMSGTPASLASYKPGAMSKNADQSMQENRKDGEMKSKMQHDTRKAPAKSKVMDGKMKREADTAKKAQVFIDPVCGMQGDTAISYSYNGKTYYFCSKSDKETFMQDPKKYISEKRK